VFLHPSLAAVRTAALAAIREAVSEDELEAELERGRRMTLDEAAREAAGVAMP
jgi:hypothetical protein